MLKPSIVTCCDSPIAINLYIKAKINTAIAMNPRKQKCLNECKDSAIVNGKIIKIITIKRIVSLLESLVTGTKYFNTSAEIFCNKIWNPINMESSKISKFIVKNLRDHLPRQMSTISCRLAAFNFLERIVMKFKLKKVAVHTINISNNPIEIPHKYNAYGSDKAVPSNNVAVI